MQMTPSLINILMVSNIFLFIANNIGMTYISTVKIQTMWWKTSLKSICNIKICRQRTEN